MSEYIEIVEEPTDDPDVMEFHTNLPLALDQLEIYHSREEMEVGSPVAQALAVIEGIQSVQLEGDTLLVTRQDDVDWYVVAADVSAVLKDFFL